MRVAAEVFADQGYRSATIRDICRRAGTNVASVNYHFGGKAGLYRAVVQSGGAFTSEMAGRLAASGGAAEDRLRAYVEVFLTRVLAEGPCAVHGRIMAREMIEPTEALDQLVDGFIRPEAEMLSLAVGEIVGKDFTREEIRLLCMSVAAQVVFYKHCRPVVERLFPDFRLDSAAVSVLAESITGFSVAGLRGLSAARSTAREAKGKGTPGTAAATRPAARRIAKGRN